MKSIPKMAKNKYILYTEEEGGEFRIVDKVIAKHTPEDTEEFFKETVKSGVLLYSVGDRIIKIKPKYIALVELTDDFDFVLGKKRDFRKEEAYPPTEQDLLDKEEGLKRRRHGRA